MASEAVEVVVPLTRPRFTAHVLGLSCAAGIGALGLALALAEGMWRAGLLYTVAGLLLAMRPAIRST